MIHHQRVLTQLIDSRRRLVRVVSLDQRTISTICVETMACRLLTFEVSKLGELSNMSARWRLGVNLGSENVCCCRDRSDGAAGVYAPMNDINLDDIWALQEAIEDKANSGDHQRGYGGLNNFPCGAETYKFIGSYVLHSSGRMIVNL